MTYSAPAPSAPPQHVKLAALLLKILAILALVNTAIAFIGQKDIEVEDDAGGEGAIVAGNVIGLLITLAIAVGAFMLAKHLLAGKQQARIWTWVLCGLWLFCGVCGICGSTLGPDVDGIPGWYTAWQWIATIAILAMAAAVAGLLATPPSNAFFNRPTLGVPTGYPPAGYSGQQPPQGYPPAAPPYAPPGPPTSPPSPPAPPYAPPNPPAGPSGPAGPPAPPPPNDGTQPPNQPPPL